MKVSVFKRSALFRRLHVSYARPGGLCVRTDEPHKWRYLNGFGFQTPSRHVWIEFWSHR